MRRLPPPDWTKPLHQALETYLLVATQHQGLQATQARPLAFELIDQIATLLTRQLPILPPEVMLHLAAAQKAATPLNIPILAREVISAIDAAVTASASRP